MSTTQPTLKTGPAFPFDKSYARDLAGFYAPVLPTPVEAPVPLVLFEHPCSCRTAAIAALNAAGRPFRIAFTSPSLPGLMAAVVAGMGVTVRSPRALRPDLAVVADLDRAALPDMEFLLYTRPGARPLALQKVEEVLQEELRREHPLYAVA